jgi:hypothetical protein
VLKIDDLMSVVFAGLSALVIEEVGMKAASSGSL